VHGVTLMSTHEHLVVTDPKRRHPDFLRRLHRWVSLGTNVIAGDRNEEVGDLDSRVV